MKKASVPSTSKRKQLSNQEQTPPVEPVTAQLILMLHSHKLCAWQAMVGLSPKALQIKGEDRLSVRDAQSLASAHADLTKRLRDDGTHLAHTLLVADHAGRQWGTTEPRAAWQLPWEWLAQRFGLGDAAPWDIPEALRDQILSWLTTADDAAQREHLQQARKSEHASETERLATERALLAQDNERLRNQNAALQQVDAERLASFLPALYPRVFTVIGPADLALLCGHIKPIALPNPYPEPVEETLRTLQKNFRALSREKQAQIVGFVTSLPHSQKLKPRPEMYDLVEELKEH